MKLLIPLLLVALAVAALVLSRRARRPPRLHRSVHRTEIARTATHVTTSVTPEEVLEEVVETLLGLRIKGRPPRRYTVGARDHRSVEIAERLVESRELAPVLTLLLEADRDGEHTRARLEFLDILAVDRVVDRLAEVTATRDAVLDVITRLDPDATFRDELLPLADENDPADMAAGARPPADQGGAPSK